jgi:predicted glycoside hydrolase/deacetylase ChbG (UPF0249 family)
MSEIRLVVQGDDLGMCHAVNEGIQRSYEQGIVTQTTAMAPCPWIDEGARFAKSSGILVGMHSTLTCEWEHLRWRPFTSGASLFGEDGDLHRTLRAAMDQLDPEEAGRELDAQFAHLQHLGIEPAYFDFHMGPTSVPAFAHVVEKHGLPFLYPFASPHYTFASSQMLSPHPANQKLAWMLDFIDGLGPGDHFLCTHPAEASPELSSMTRRDAANAVWANDYRLSDLAVLTSGAVRDRIEQRGVELVSVEALTPTDSR